MKCKICLFDRDLFFNKEKEVKILTVLDYVPRQDMLLQIDGEYYTVYATFIENELVGVKPMFDDEEEGWVY